MGDKAIGGKAKGVICTPKLHNEIIDAKNAHKRTELGRAVPQRKTVISQTSLYVKNLTGGNLPRGAVVDIGEYLLSESDPLDATHPWFEGNTQDGGNWGVLTKPIPEDDIDECQIAGRCVARVNILNIDHTRAFPKAGQTYFESSHMGPVAILRLSDVDATGVQECYVLLRVPVFTLRGVAVDTLGHATTGTVNLVKKTSSGYFYMRNGDGDHLTLEASAYSLNTSESIEADTPVYLSQFEDGSIEATSGNCALKDWDLEDED